MPSPALDIAPDCSTAPGILQHLDKVVSSPAFAKSLRLAAFLRWVVEQEISGNRAQITERNLALIVYERGPDFDPRLDGTVRAEAMRLRNKLREYYEGADPESPRIAIPKGGYSPLFTGFEPAIVPPAIVPVNPEPVPAQPIPGLRRPLAFPVLAAVAAVAAIAVLLVGRPAPPSARSAPSPADTASAVRLLDRAHSLWRVGASPEARDVLERALVLDSGNARIHLAYSAVLQNLGYDERTREEAARASHLAVAEGIAGDLAFEGRVRSANADWPAAIRAYRFLLNHNPRDFDAALALAQSQVWTRDLPGCIDTAALARNMTEGARNPELERLDALCRAAMSDNAGALEAVKRGEKYAESAGLRGPLSRLILLDAGIVQNLGGNSLPILARARALCNEVRDEICLVKVSRVSAIRMVSSAEFPEAIKLYEGALPAAERLHNNQEMGNLVSGLTMALEQMGDLHAADAAYARYAAISPGVADGYELLPLRAQFAYLRGDLGQAEVLVREAMDHGAHAHTPTTEATDRLLLSLIEIQRGDLGEARENLRRTSALVREYKGAGDSASLHTENALLEAAAGNWDRAMGELDAADRIPGQDAPAWYDTRIAALRIHLWRGDTRFILAHAAAYSAELEKARRMADAAEGRAILSEAALQTGDADTARRELQQAQALTTAESPLLTQLAVLRAAVLASHDKAEADRLGDESLQLASRAGFRIELYEARLTREERRLMADPAEALSELGRLSDEMDRVGLHGLAGRPRTMLLRARVQHGAPAAAN